MRAFVAVDLAEPWLDALEGLQAHMRTGRVVPRENLHLTLAFLGEAREDELEELHDALGALPRRQVVLRAAGLDLFGSATAPRILHLAVADSPELTALQAGVVRGARKTGLELERRRFRPHVTLARFSRTARADPGALARFLADHAGFGLPEMAAQSMGLYASMLRPDGAEYEALATYPLG